MIVTCETEFVSYIDYLTIYEGTFEGTFLELFIQPFASVKVHRVKVVRSVDRGFGRVEAKEKRMGGERRGLVSVCRDHPMALSDPTNHLLHTTSSK